MALSAPTRDAPPAEATPPVLFFDGECGFCNRAVVWLLAHERERVLRFAPLQGELAAEKLPALPDDIEDWSVVLWDAEGLHLRSDAAIRVIAAAGGPWRLARLLLGIPRGLRDAGYQCFARNRIRWFGRVESCALLSPEDRERLLP